MIKVAIRHVDWIRDDAIEIGEFNPNEVKDVVELIKKFGVSPFPETEVTENLKLLESQYDLDYGRFEIVVH